MTPPTDPHTSAAESADPADAALRRALRDSLHRPDAAPPSEALQDRVMAQWAQRHAAELAWQTAPAGAAPTAPRRPWRARLAIAALALALALGAVWQHRADAALDELTQPDLLMLITLGEI